VLIHLACGLLLAGIIARTLRASDKRWQWAIDAHVPLVVAAIWLLHPLQTEAVDYVVQRTELLVSLFCLASIYSSVRAWDAAKTSARNTWIGLATFACLLGMGSKEVMVVTPLIVVLYDRAFRVSAWRDLLRLPARLTLYSLLVATMAWSAVLNMSGPRADSVGFGLGTSWGTYLYSQGWAVAHYLRLAAWPRPLIIDYGQNPVIGLRPIPGIVVLLSIAAVTCWAWIRSAQWSWLAFLGTVFFLLLAPSSSIVPIRTEIAAERRIYLAFAAVVIVSVVSIAVLVRTMATTTRFGARWAQWLHARAAWASTAVCVILAVATFQRSSAYAQPELLWRPVVSAMPGNARGFNGLAMAIAHDSLRLGEAEHLFHQAIDRDSALGPAWLNLAYVQARLGLPAAAESTLKHATTLKDNQARSLAVERYGRILVERTSNAEAVPYLEQATAQRESPENLYWLGVAYLRSGRASDAARVLYRASVLAPDQIEVLRQLGRALIESGRPADAIDYLKAAIVRQPTSLSLALLSAADAAMGRSEDASDAAAASARVGDELEAHVIAGGALMTIHRVADAQWHFAQAVRLHPDDCAALTGLGSANAALGNSAAAVRLLRHALEKNSECDAARDQLRRLQ
jgi:tetratricopeptide (TPR) repeat protein